jgi:hypothetical protein
VPLAPLDELNRAPEAELPRLLAPLFEDAGILAAPIAAGRPYGSWAEVVDAAELARRSALSFAEQGGAAGADTTADERLAVLNDQYEARFGFPFVVFAAGRPRAELAGVLKARLGRPRAVELAEGTAAMVAIARDRLRKLTRELTREPRTGGDA